MSFSIKSDSSTQNPLSPIYKREQGSSSSQSLLFPLFNSEQGSSSSQSIISPMFSSTQESSNPQSLTSSVTVRRQKSLPLSGRCLVVDDNKMNRIVVVAALGKLGIKAEQAENGEEALKKLKSDGNFDFAVFDNSMPGMSGLEALRRYHSEGDGEKTPISEGDGEKTPIIGWTTDGEEIEKQFLEEGAIATLKKPLNKKNLETVLTDEKLLPSPPQKSKKDSKKSKKKKTSSKQETGTHEPVAVTKIRSAGDKVEPSVMNEKTEENPLKKVFSSE